MESKKKLYEVDKTNIFVPNSKKKHKKYFDNEPEIVRRIRKSKTNLVFVLLTAEEKALLEAKGCKCRRTYKYPPW